MYRGKQQTAHIWQSRYVIAWRMGACLAVMALIVLFFAVSAQAQSVSEPAPQSGCGLTNDGRAYCGNEPPSEPGVAEGSLLTPPSLRPFTGSSLEQNAPFLSNPMMSSQQGAPAFTLISAGGSHTCAIGADGWVYCWGANARGQLGAGDFVQRTAPTAISSSTLPSGVTFTDVSAGLEHTCAVASNGSIYCWGNGDYGQVGEEYDMELPFEVAMDELAGGVLFQTVSAGWGHTCATASDGWVYCWGNGEWGQLGYFTFEIGNVLPKAIMENEIPFGVTLQSVEAGYLHTCAIASNDISYCWGDNDYGQLGNWDWGGSGPIEVSYEDVPVGDVFEQISGGGMHSCATASDGWVYCWGNGDYGQVGRNVFDMFHPHVLPINDSSDLSMSTTLVGTSSGELHTCAISQAGQAYCWGDNEHGQLGAGDLVGGVSARSVEQGEMLPGTQLIQISAGDSHTCALADTGQAYCWGAGANGRLGNEATAQSTVPVAVLQSIASEPEEPAFSLTQSTTRMYAASTSPSPGNPLAASDAPAELSSAGSAFRVRVGVTNQGEIPAGATIKAISSGIAHTCAIASDDWVYCWGSGANGRLGNGTTADASTPVAIVQGAIPSGAALASISVGDAHACALTSSSQAYCWGSGANGRLGNGITSSSNAPVAVLQGDLPTGATLESISVGNAHACVLASDDWVYCWGWGANGRLGSDATVDASTPAAVVQGALPVNAIFTSVSVGSAHTCGLASNDQAYCWGAGGSGRLGNDSSINRLSPVAVSQGAMPTGSTVVSISAGNAHTCAIASNNQAYCWGWGANGRLGNNATESIFSSPTAVAQGSIPSGVTVQSISAGSAHTCAIASNNQAYCWGQGANGRLGNGVVTGNFTTPATVLRGAIQYENQISVGQLPLILEFAPRATTCSAVASWTAVSSTSTLAYAAAPPNHGQTISSIPEDPSLPGGSTGFSYQSIVRGTTTPFVFTNTQSIDPGETALYDFPLIDRSVTAGQSYCFRLVVDESEPDIAITERTVYPEISTAPGQLSLRFIDGSGNTLSSPATNTAFGNGIVMPTMQQTTGQLTNGSSKRLELVSTLGTGWSVNLSATGGPAARWQTEGNVHSYPYNAATAGQGQLRTTIDTVTYHTFGSQPNGLLCESTALNITIPLSGVFQPSVSSLTLFSGNAAAGFNCPWILQNMGLEQTIPALQSPGEYRLDMTITAVSS